MTNALTVSERLNIVNKTASRCPHVEVTLAGQKVTALLDSGSQVTLIRESFFNNNILSHLRDQELQSSKEAAKIFRLKSASDTVMPVKYCLSMDIGIYGTVVPDVGILVLDDHATVSASKLSRKANVVVGWNLIKIAYEQFCKTYGDSTIRLCQCPPDMSPSLFAQLVIYHQTSNTEQSSGGISASTGKQSKKKRPRDVNPLGDSGKVGKVTVGSRREPLVIPARSMLTVPGKCITKFKGPIYLEQAESCNLPKGLTVNACYTHRLRQRVNITLINNSEQNIWLRETFHAADAYCVDLLNMEHKVDLVQTSNDEIEVSFLYLPQEDVLIDLINQSVRRDDKDEDQELPKFGPKPDTSSPEFNFESELDRLPFKFNLGEVSLSLDQQRRLIDLIYDHQDVFSLHDGDFGQCDAIKHTIPTTTDKPVYLPHRVIPFKLQDEVRKCLDSWLKQGIIRPSRSPYASQVVIVRKKSGEIRLCIDFRKLNDVTIRDAFPLPRIEEALQAVQKAKYFCSIDLAQGYLQVAMDEKDIHKTAFRAGSGGLYEFARMPFGLSNAGATFCRLMEMCLGDQQYLTLLLYLDDICIFAEDEDQLLDRLQLVFQRLSSFKLKIKPKKSFFFQRSVLFLGHVLSNQGISVNPEKVEKIKDWPRPQRRKDLHSFLGLASYYRRFIPGFAAIVKPLQELLGPTNNKSLKNVPITDTEWTGLCEVSFLRLKDVLTSAPVLAYPDYSKPFKVETDASLSGLGAVLSQEHNGRDKVIAYASRSLRPAEKSMRNYSSAKLELLALKWAITEKFREYLWGSKFTVYTDNNPLAYVQKSKLGAAQIRWMSELALYDFEIKYRSGKSNVVADALSRRPNPAEADLPADEDYDTLFACEVKAILEEVIEGRCFSWELKSAIQSQLIPGYTGDVSSIDLETEDVTISQMASNIFPSSISPEAMAKAQKRDPVLGIVYDLVKLGIKISRRFLLKQGKLIRKYLAEIQKYRLLKGVLHRQVILDGYQKYQLVLPAKFRHTVFKLLHDEQGHQRTERTLSLFKERFFWHSMSKDVPTWVQNCKRCQEAKQYANLNIKPSSIITSHPMELLCIDFTLMDKSDAGQENVLVMTDAFSKFSQAVVCPNQKASTVAKALVDKWFYVYGIPNRIHSDQGKSFCNAVIAELCKMYGIEQSSTTPYNPRGNAICERFNRTLHNLLIALPKEHKGKWPKYLPSVLFAYNATPHSTTQLQPYELMFGRKASLPCDSWLGLQEYCDEVSKPKTQWLKDHRELLLAANRRAVRNIQQQAKQTKVKSKGKDLQIPVGNLVLLRDHPAGRNKIQDAFKSSPYVVEGKHSDPNVYYIKPVDGSGGVFSANRRQLRDLGHPPQITTKDPPVDETLRPPLYRPVPKPRKSLTKSPKPSYNLRQNIQKPIRYRETKFSTSFGSLPVTVTVLNDPGGTLEVNQQQIGIQPATYTIINQDRQIATSTSGDDPALGLTVTRL